MSAHNQRRASSVEEGSSSKKRRFDELLKDAKNLRRSAEDSRQQLYIELQIEPQTETLVKEGNQGDQTPSGTSRAMPDGYQELAQYGYPELGAVAGNLETLRKTTRSIRDLQKAYSERVEELYEDNHHELQSVRAKAESYFLELEEAKADIDELRNDKARTEIYILALEESKSKAIHRASIDPNELKDAEAKAETYRLELEETKSALQKANDEHIKFRNQRDEDEAFRHENLRWALSKEAERDRHELKRANNAIHQIALLPEAIKPSIGHESPRSAATC